MANSHSASSAAGNHLLARLSRADHDRLLPHLRTVPLEQDQVLHEARSVVRYAHFPLRGVTSFLTVLSDGDAIEVATVGNEGMTGG